MKPRWSNTITRIRAPLIEDQYGVAAGRRDWAHADELDVLGCDVQPIAGSKYTLDREAIVARWRLFAPDGADIVATDRIRSDGLVYEIDGDVQIWAGSHLESFLRRAAG
jgi:hypothetical protein